MGRYDALLEPSKPPAPHAVPSTTPQPENREPSLSADKKPASPQTHAPPPLHKKTTSLSQQPANPQAGKTPYEKPEKYTTRLKPRMIKRVKIFAAEKEVKDYEVVETALLEYFERHK